MSTYVARHCIIRQAMQLLDMYSIILYVCSQTPLSETGSLTEGALAFDAIATGGALTIDTGADPGTINITFKGVLSINSLHAK